MPGSIPASATVEAAALPTPAAAGVRWPGRLLRVPAGAVGLALTVALVTVAVLADQLAPTDPFQSVASPLAPPSWRHPMGTDDLGRDLLAGVVHGARTSLVVVLAVSAIATVIGIGVGALAGYRGRVTDDALMRATEFVQVVPRFFLAVVVIALFGPGLDRLVVLLGLTSWPWLARVVRAETLTLRTQPWVDAARSLGAPTGRILLRHVLPNALPPTLVVVSLNAASVLLLEAGLSFLGLGDPHRMSWGYLASNAQRFLRVAWWMTLFPGLAIALAVLGLNLLGDALNDALNPRRPR